MLVRVLSQHTYPAIAHVSAKLRTAQRRIRPTCDVSLPRCRDFTAHSGWPIFVDRNFAGFSVKRHWSRPDHGQEVHVGLQWWPLAAPVMTNPNMRIYAERNGDSRAMQLLS